MLQEIFFSLLDVIKILKNKFFISIYCIDLFLTARHYRTSFVRNNLIMLMLLPATVSYRANAVWRINFVMARRAMLCGLGMVNF